MLGGDNALVNTRVHVKEIANWHACARPLLRMRARANPASHANRLCAVLVLLHAHDQLTQRDTCFMSIQLCPHDIAHPAQAPRMALALCSLVAAAHDMSPDPQLLCRRICTCARR